MNTETKETLRRLREPLNLSHLQNHVALEDRWVPEVLGAREVHTAPSLLKT